MLQAIFYRLREERDTRQCDRSPFLPPRPLPLLNGLIWTLVLQGGKGQIFPPATQPPLPVVHAAIPTPPLDASLALSQPMEP